MLIPVSVPLPYRSPQTYKPAISAIDELDTIYSSLRVAQNEIDILPGPKQSHLSPAPRRHYPPERLETETGSRECGNGAEKSGGPVQFKLGHRSLIK